MGNFNLRNRGFFSLANELNVASEYQFALTFVEQMDEYGDE
jgi:hypothetical protein